jgi:hypothetical protein
MRNRKGPRLQVGKASIGRWNRWFQRRLLEHLLRVDRQVHKILVRDSWSITKLSAQIAAEQSSGELLEEHVDCSCAARAVR